MKKLLTLAALLTCFMGASAQNWVQVYQVDYSKYTGFPFYVMGYVPEWNDGIMTDLGAMYSYKSEADVAEDDNVVGDVAANDGTVYKKVELTSPGWHQYFIADGIKTQLDGTYKAVALVKASEAVSINVNMGWGWGEGQQTGTSVSIPQSDDFVEVEWEYTGIGGSSCNLVAQPGTATAVIEWKSVTVFEDQREQRPVTWQQWLTNDGNSIIPGVETTSFYMGDAETPWADPNVKFDDQEKNYLICAWGKEREVNMNDDGGWDPFPATIEEEGGNHYYVVHGKAATTEGDASAWDNQFWIQSPREWKSGTQLRIKFSYKASKNVTVATQCHKQNPSDYLIWHAIGDIAFTTEWQEFEDVITIADDMAGTWSVAFQLNQNDKDAIDFYFDNLSWESMVLDEGYFVASANTATGINYDFDNAKEFDYDEDEALYIATVGTEGKEDSWVNEIMISTIRGNDAAFKGATLKPSGAIISDPDEWPNYTESALAKIKLPAAGVWQISIDTDAKQMNFVQLEGEAPKEPLEVIPNPNELVVNALERDDLTDGQDNEGNPIINEEEGGTGQPWDNQFWIMADRKLDKGEATIISFKYRSSIDAKVSTQCHANPGSYLHYAALGDFNFTSEWQEFETTFTVPDAADGMQSIAFNMAEIREACDYYIKDVVWMTEDRLERLVNPEGTANFYYKVVGGAIIQFGKEGDVNGDTVVDVADISSIISVMAGTADYPAADVNGDGVIDVADISSVITIMAGK